MSEASAARRWRVAMRASSLMRRCVLAGSRESAETPTTTASASAVAGPLPSRTRRMRDSFAGRAVEVEAGVADGLPDGDGAGRSTKRGLRTAATPPSPAVSRRLGMRRLRRPRALNASSASSIPRSARGPPPPFLAHGLPPSPTSGLPASSSANGSRNTSVVRKASAKLPMLPMATWCLAYVSASVALAGPPDLVSSPRKRRLS
mmetsp:Transcript_65116/g.153763  ORF Transcript_65116/g.153763 Transcript_65116/m.153763 type:complete len:204 (+) Transcript_65116:1048-1659(+)